jgi:uncharacterized membrane protein YdjX (TVP38/TMEM64 family)
VTRIFAAERPSIAKRLSWVVLIGSITAVAWSLMTKGIAYDLLHPDLDATEKIGRLRQFFAEFGMFAPLVYFLFVVAEVIVAPIPGLMLYAPGGVIFGGFVGGALSLAGNVVGAGIACLIVRSFGDAWLTRYFSAEKVAATQGRLERYGGWPIFFLRLNPITSSDVVSYAAGLTRIPVTTVMLATGLGIAPLCFAQAYFAESILQAFPKLIYLFVALCVAYFLFVIAAIRGMAAPTNEVRA